MACFGGVLEWSPHLPLWELVSWPRSTGSKGLREGLRELLVEKQLVSLSHLLVLIIKIITI